MEIRVTNLASVALMGYTIKLLNGCPISAMAFVLNAISKLYVIIACTRLALVGIVDSAIGIGYGVSMLTITDIFNTT